jgi:hypothetical protein
MELSHELVYASWMKVGGRCECRNPHHKHHYVSCNKLLVWQNRGHEDMGAWEAHPIDTNETEIPGNCEILCWDCHIKTESLEKG